MTAIKAIRQSIKLARRRLPVAFQEACSHQVFKHLKQLDIYRYAKHIALYKPTQGEISLAQVWQSAPMQGKFCYYPVLKDKGFLQFLPATPASTFKKNKYGISEPVVSENKAMLPLNLDLILIPLVAFDIYGNRIGMGKGYYDKTLQDIKKNKKVHLVGIAYDFQKRVILPFQPWDIYLDYIVTEKKAYRCIR